MDPDLVFIVTYECPACRVSLEDRSSGSPAWQKCPNCGRASMPPDHQRFHRNPPVKQSMASPLGDFVIGPETGALPIRPRSMAPLPSSDRPRTSPLRIVMGSGFVASLILALFALLDSNTTMAGLFGFVAIVCLIVLFVPAGRPPGE